MAGALKEWEFSKEETNYFESRIPTAALGSDTWDKTW